MPAEAALDRRTARHKTPSRQRGFRAMTNRNHKYQNGIAKREAIKVIRADLLQSGAFVPQSNDAVVARIGFHPRFIIDTNVMYGVIEYWMAPLRRAIRDLADAQPSLRLYLLDVVASECRGMKEKRRLYDEIVWNGSNPDTGVIRPLDSHTREVARIHSDLLLHRPEPEPLKPSDLKDYLIAATAIAYDMTVLTCNASDFATIAAIDQRLRYHAFEGPGATEHKGELLLDYLGSLYVERSSMVPA
jgi:predicted nucleic acid-binding protein